MMTYATIRDVAERAGVSVSTVSRALNDSGRISEQTRERVNQVIKELRYVPDSRARSMHFPHSRAIGLLIPDIRNSYFADLAYRIQGELLAHGFQTLICTSTQGDSHENKVQVRNLLGQHIDGAIIVPDSRSSQILNELTRRGLPLVYVDRPNGSRRHEDGEKAVPSIDSDPLPGLNAALEDLARHGHRRIAMVSGPLKESGIFQEREDAFDRLLNGMNGLCDPTRNGDRSGIGRAGEGTFVPEMLDRWRALKVSAAVFGSSQDAIRAIKTCQSRGISIGSDLSIVTFDDLPVFRILTPAVATISQQIDSMGTCCVRMLLDLMAGSRIDSVRLKTRYLHRASVGWPPGRTGQGP